MRFLKLLSLSLVLLTLYISVPSTPAQDAPADVKAVINSALTAVNNRDAAALQTLCAGNARTIFSWVFRPTLPTPQQRPDVPGIVADRPVTPRPAGLRDAASSTPIDPASAGSKAPPVGSPVAGQNAAGPGPDRGNRGPGGGFGRQRIDWKAGAVRLPAASASDAASGWEAVFWDVHPAESEGDHVHRLLKQGGIWKIGPEISETETLGFRIVNHRIAVQFDLPKHGVAFTDSVLFERTQPEASTLQLRLSADFTIDSIKPEDANTASLAFSQVGGVIYTTAPAGKQFKLTLQYHGNPDHPDRFVSNVVDPAEVVLSAYWYPTIARLPTTSEVTVTVPKGWTAIAQGDLEGRSDQTDSSQFTYRMPVANCYFTLDAGPYYIYERTIGGRRYSVYLLKPDEDRAEKQLAMMDSSFRLFERLWGPYPFDHYTIVETQQPGWSGALEAYTFTTYRRGMLPTPNPHEWAHTWWGGFVPNTYLQDIWNESFASYSETVFYRYGESPDHALYQKVYWRRPTPGMDRLTSTVPLSDSRDALTSTSSIVGYRKGALVLQNLEDTLGFPMMMKCMRVFREQHQKGEAATWTEFERVVDHVTGKDYAWWFNQWVRRAGLPSLRWDRVTAAPDKQGYLIRADIVQAEPLYRLTVPIWITGSSGETVKATREITAARTPIELQVTWKPQQLLLDPEFRLPRAVTSEETGTPETGFGRRVPGVPTIMVAHSRDALAGRLAAGRPGGGRGLGMEVKLDTEVTEADLADLKNDNIILVGDASSNKLWARFASDCPFQVSGDSVTFAGKTYRNVQARAVTRSPLNPARTITWLNHTGSLFDQVPAEVTIYDDSGRLLAAKETIAQGGPTVFKFPEGGKVAKGSALTPVL